MPPIPSSEPSDSPGVTAPLFICDNTAEGVALAQALVGAGYDVFRVPLTLLTSRVEVQKPAAIIVNVDAPSALAAAQQVRDIPGSRTIHVLFVGEPGCTLRTDSDAEFYEGSAFFPRPLDTAGVLERIELLVGHPAPRNGHPSGVSGPPSSTGAGGSPSRSPISSIPGVADSLPAGAAGPSSIPLSHAGEAFGAPSVEPAPLSLSPVPPADGEVGGGGWVLEGTLIGPSPELTSLLQEAEARVKHVTPVPSRPRPAPAKLEEVGNAILSPEILSSLAEPLELEDEAAEQEPALWEARASTEAGRTGTSMGTHNSEVALPPQSASGASDASGTGAASSIPQTGTEPPTPTPRVQQRRGSPAVDGRAVPQLPSPIPALASDSEIHSSAEDATPTPPPLRSSTAITLPPRASHRGSNAEAVTIPHSSPARSLRLDIDLAHGNPSRSPQAPARGADVHVMPASSSGSHHPKRSFAPLATGVGTQREPEGASGSLAPSSSGGGRPSSQLHTPKIPEAMGQGDAVRGLAQAIRNRFTGALALEDPAGIRRVVFRDGDFVIVASGVDGESLVAFLVHRGHISHDAVALGRKLPQFGRHAGAALIAHGHLRQEELWPVLRTHAEWLLGRCMQIERGGASLERNLAARLAAEPDVFGGSPGAEVFVEIARRAIAPELALQRILGPEARLGPVEELELLDECGLEAEQRELIVKGRGETVGTTVSRSGSRDFASVLYALRELGVLDISRKTASSSPPPPRMDSTGDVLDDDAIRARIARRRSLVDEGDYFSLLGVGANATGYEIRRAYLDLRRDFQPSILLTARTADLHEDLELILEVVDEAYDVLKDDVRRERYRRALLGSGRHC